MKIQQNAITYDTAARPLLSITERVHAYILTNLNTSGSNGSKSMYFNYLNHLPMLSPRAGRGTVFRFSHPAAHRKPVARGLCSAAMPGDPAG
jgi:hypothetical protein